MLYRNSILSLLFSLCAVLATAATLKRVAVIDLPGPRGAHFDHLSIDYEDHYLLSAHTEPGILYVIDIRTKQLVATIHGLLGITAPIYVPGLKKIYTCDWGENKVAVISLKDMKVIKRLPTGEKPNGGAYAEPFGKVYISDTLGKQLSVIDVHTDSIVKTLRFPSETGMAQFDPVSNHVYVNLRSTDRLAEIDPATDSVIARYPVGRCDFNHGLALDPTARRAFLLCVGNNLFTVFALDSHQPVAYIPLPEGADDVAFDPGLHRIYVTCESGAITVIQEDDANHFRKLEDFAVEPGVHTLAVDVTTHRLYAPEAEENGRDVSRIFVFEPVP
ncbi:MAG TPA: YncE family protein [Candidatus Acidoferrales bacterium]|nr:YncE family protein [Candidatus Acidoferrales bacterium]